MSASICLIVFSGLLVQVIHAEYYVLLESKTQEKAIDCYLYAGTTVAAQCNPDDLTTVLPSLPPYDNKTVWIEKGNLCTSTTCPALVRNSADQIASISIQCLNCDEKHGALCTSTEMMAGDPKLERVMPTGGIHTGSCNDVWVRTENKKILISPVRRTLSESHDWCMSRNGSALQDVSTLKFIETMIRPEPVMPYYWIAVLIDNYNGGNPGAVLTSVKTDGTSFTTTYNIDIPSSHTNKYGCICIQTDSSVQTTSASTTEQTSTSTTATTEQTSTSTTATTEQTSTSTTATTTTTTTMKPVTNMKTGKFENKINMNGYMKPAGGADEFTARRSMDCAKKCAQFDACRSFFFDKTTSSCQLFGNLFTSTSSLIPAATAKYYVKC